MKATTSQLSRSFCSNLAWEKFFGESFPGSSVHHPESGDEFYAEYSTWNLSSIRFVEIFSSVRFRVDGQPPREGEEFFFLTLPIAGKLRFQALGEPSQAGEHLLILADASKPHSVEYEAQTRFLALRIPKSLLCRYLDVVSTQLKFATKTGNGSSLLAWTLCKSIWDQKSNIRPDESRALSLTVTQLLASAFGAESGVMEYAGSSRTQRHFVRVCEYIDRNFMDPELTIGRIAQRCGVTERYVHMLLAKTGKTCMQYILERRLECSRRLLLSAQFNHCSITDIAYECGFSSVSHFCRSFRERYGETPSQQRSHTLSPPKNSLFIGER